MMEIERAGMGLHERRQLGDLQPVINGARLRLVQHAGGEIDADQRARVRPQQRAAPSGSGACVEHVEGRRRRADHRRDGVGDQRGRPVVEALQHLVEAVGETVECLGDVDVGGARGHTFARRRREIVLGQGIVGLDRQPALVDGGCFVRAAEQGELAPTRR